MTRPVDQAALAKARQLFREYIAIAGRLDRATTPQVRAELDRALKGVAAAFEIEDLDSYFVARTSARNALPADFGEAAQLVTGIRNASPLWIAGVADALLESIGAAP